MPTPLRVRAVSDDSEWIFVEGSETGSPMDETIVETPAAPPASMPRAAPTLPLKTSKSDDQDHSLERGEVELMRSRVDQNSYIRIIGKGDLILSPKAIGKLIKLLEVQKSVLEED